MFFPSSRLLDSTFSDPYFSLLSFFSSELIPFYQAEKSPSTFLHGSSSWVPRDNRPLLMSCWFLSLLIPFLHHWMADRDIFVMVPCVSWHAPLNCLNPNLALLHAPRIPSSWESLGILAQFFSWALRVAVGFFFPLFHEVRNLPIHGFGSLLMDP